MSDDRVRLTLKVTADTKRRINRVARDTGRTQSQKAERLIEIALRFLSVTKAISDIKEK